MSTIERLNTEITGLKIKLDYLAWDNLQLKAEVDRLRNMLDMDRNAMEANEALGAALVEARAEIDRLRRGEVDGIFTSVVHECCEQVARVRALIRAQEYEHNDYETPAVSTDALRAALGESK